MQVVTLILMILAIILAVILIIFGVFLILTLLTIFGMVKDVRMLVKTMTKLNVLRFLSPLLRILKERS